MTSEKLEPEASIRKLCNAKNFNKATHVIVETYGPEILNSLLRTLNDEDKAQDVYSVWCVDVWNGIEAFQWRSKCRTWCYKLAHHAMCRYKRPAHAKRNRRIITRDKAVFEAMNRDAQLRARRTTDIYRKTAVKERFRQIRQQLSEEERMLLVLRLEREMSWNEIAHALVTDTDLSKSEELRKASGKLRSRYHQLKAKLKKLAKDEGIFRTNNEAIVEEI